MSETAEPETVQNRKWCEKMFDRLPFVEWDRLVVGNVITDSQAITAHGWIDRDDGHEDFVVMILWTADRTVFAHTSSPEYSAEISQRLFGDTDDHNDCRPIEDTLNVSPSRSPSLMDSARYDLLVPQATSTRQCPLDHRYLLLTKKCLLVNDGYNTWIVGSLQKNWFLWELSRLLWGVAVIQRLVLNLQKQTHPHRRELRLNQVVANLVKPLPEQTTIHARAEEKELLVSHLLRLRFPKQGHHQTTHARLCMT